MEPDASVAELRRRDVEAAAGRGVEDREPVDGLGGVALDRLHAPRGQRLRVAADDERRAVAAGVLDLHALEPVVPAHDEVDVPVLAERDRDAVALLDQVGGDHELREVASALERSHVRTVRSARVLMGRCDTFVTRLSHVAVRPAAPGRAAATARPVSNEPAGAARRVPGQVKRPAAIRQTSVGSDEVQLVSAWGAVCWRSAGGRGRVSGAVGA
jgi:hypothetical protein